ncbi:MAG: ATP-binding protein [Eubacterium sp.]|nr:ATP-binding protein [Eubacterium sp.]
MDVNLALSPSRMGKYYEMNCLKSLVYEAVNSETRDRLNWPKKENSIRNAAAIAGDEWERILYERLDKDPGVELINLKSRQNHIVTYEETVEAIRRLNFRGKTGYIYQANIKATDTFNRKYFSNLEPGRVAFAKSMFPDYIRVEYIAELDKYRMTIIDAKNASFLKVGATVQVALYVKLLKCILEQEHIDNCFVNEEEGITWNREKVTDNCLEHVFKLKDASQALDVFFNEKLNDLVKCIDECKDGTELAEALDYRVSQKCEYCDNFNACKASYRLKQYVTMMPYISIEAQDRLDFLKNSGQLENESLESVYNLLETNPELLTEDCAFWRGVNNNRQAYRRGLEGFCRGIKEKHAKGGTSITFPKNQNFSLFVTGQQDVSSGRIYAYSWLLRPGYGIDIWDQGLNENGFVSIYEGREQSPGKGTYYASVVANEKTKEEFDRIDRVFVEAIYELFRRINAYEDESKKRLQCYVMDHYERRNIEGALFNMLETLDSVENQALLEKVMSIIFWLQGERLVTDSKALPERCVDNPVTVLTSEISRLYVLSEGVGYNLKSIASIFSPDYNFDNDNRSYMGTLSNIVEGMNIINAWNSDDLESKKRQIDALAGHLRKRLFVEARIASKVQNDPDIYLNVPAAIFSMMESKYPDYPEIARLDFENKYEQLLTYQQIRGVRASGIQNAIDKGNILWLQYDGYNDENYYETDEYGYNREILRRTYTILNQDTYIGRDWFTAWLCEDTPENRTQLMLLQDRQYTSNRSTKFAKNYRVEDIASGIVSIFHVNHFDQVYNFTDDGTRATVDFYPRDDFRPRHGGRYLLFEAYNDMNSDKTEAGIKKLIPSEYTQGLYTPPGQVADMDNSHLIDPPSLSGPTGITFDYAAESVCSRYWSPDGYTFSPSQKKAFIHLFEQKLNVLVGPPASGKTDFIGRSLITLSSYYKAVLNRNLKIMVTANSHSAIENVLLKLNKMLKGHAEWGIKLYKASRFDDSEAFRNSSVNLIADKCVSGVMNRDEIQVIGMTAWSAYKEFHGPYAFMHRFDVIVMDEASQVRAMDSFLPLECSNISTRFLLVGDDDQLPPIIAGKYKEVEGQKYIHGSVFHMYLTGLGENHRDVVRLSDNFRMNGILCKYPSLALYGPSYVAANDKIRDQKILLDHEPEDELISFLLDREFPLVFVELTGVGRDQNAGEIDLVTKLIKELHDHQVNEDSGRLVRDEGNFWRDSYRPDGSSIEGACGIISPHHEHINRLRTSLSAAMNIQRDDIFIGTVDKLQGKERKAVIVSYGVSEAEKIRNESEFIFSHNRFNVSITRGKAKTIVILSDAIAESNMMTTVMTSSDQALGKGISFIHGFVNYMKEERPDEEMQCREFNHSFPGVTFKVWKKFAKGVRPFW